MTARRRALAERRKAVGYSQEALAEVLRVEPSTVGRWERGETAPQPWCRPKLARALGLSNEALGELLNDAAQPESVAPAPGAPIAEEGEALHRREFRKHGIAAAAFPALGLDDPTTVATDSAAQSASMRAVLAWTLMIDPEPTTLERTNGSRSVSLADVEALRAVQCSLTALDAEHGGGVVLPIAMVYLRSEVAPRLHGSYPERVGRQLFAAAAELTLVTGFIAYDAGQHGLARQQLVEALRLSHVAGDRALGARVLTTMSHQALHLDERDDALVFACAARSAVKACVPGVRAVCAATEARALAVMGERRACFALMAEAERALSRACAEDAPAWLRFLDEAELTGKFGRCLRDLGLHADAERQLETSLNLHKSSYPRSRAITQIIYATNHVRQGHLEAACQLGIAAIPAVGRLRSQRTREYLGDLRDHLSPYAPEPIVREFTERAGELVTTRHA